MVAFLLLTIFSNTDLHWGLKVVQTDIFAISFQNYIFNVHAILQDDQCQNDLEITSLY